MHAVAIKEIIENHKALPQMHFGDVGDHLDAEASFQLW